jgi:hypothetical protein
MAYTLAIQSPVFNGFDAITGWHTHAMPEYGSFETIGMAFKKADLLHDEFRLDLGDGDNIQVWEGGQRVHTPPPRDHAYWLSEADLAESDLPF